MSEDDVPDPVGDPSAVPRVEVVRDFEGYFETLTRGLLAEKQRDGQAFRRRVVVVEATPYLSDAVRYELSEDGRQIRLLFYSALRNHFGVMSPDDWAALRDLL